MTRDDRPGRRGLRAGLSAEDRALWDHVAQSVAPARRRKVRVPELGSDDCQAGSTDHDFYNALRSHAALASPPPIERPAGGTGGNGAGQAKAARGTAHGHPGARLAERAKQHQPPLADVDRKAVRRIRRGQIAIEARVDLHGMRQDEAHRALRVFLHGCQSRGLRWALVITGKGGAAGSADHAENFPYGEPQRGVLRRQVPRWLAEPDLRPIVVSYTSAALHHGGDGALYVQLRAKRGHSGS